MVRNHTCLHLEGLLDVPALVFRPGEGLLQMSEFTRWLEREGITVLILPTAYWHEWVRALEGHPAVHHCVVIARRCRRKAPARLCRAARRPTTDDRHPACLCTRAPAGIHGARLTKRMHGFKLSSKLRSAVISLGRWWKEQARGVLFQLIRQVYASPRRLRAVDHLAFYRMITRQYAVHPYSGCLVLFRSEGHLCFERDSLLWWGDLATVVEVREIAGLHGTFLTEPHIHVLEQQLITCLQQAGEAHAGQ